MHGVDAILVSPLRRPTYNLAAEEYLFTHRSDTVLLLYVNSPAVVLGTNQALESEVDQVYCRTHNLPIVRRLSGGGAVYHDEGNLNVCLLRNREPGCYPLDVGVTQPLQAALLDMGLPVTMGTRKDLWLNGCKIAGTASHFNRTRSLHHATLLYDADLVTLNTVLKAHHAGYNPQKGKAIASMPSSVTNIKVYLAANHKPIPATTVYFAQLAAVLLRHYGLDALTEFTQEDRAAIEILEQTKYTQPAWIERR